MKKAFILTLIFSGLVFPLEMTLQGGVAGSEFSAFTMDSNFSLPEGPTAVHNMLGGFEKREGIFERFLRVLATKIDRCV